ncbi:MAG TPA: EamA family transporter [Desulfurella acetivorans]|uniref:EamA family transporter n=1 Tax=Desulfurella acetivorans TaxID=33002 RepID=A0A7C6E8H3_DESAE|nr:EamA family transporter [Desulfurella acetivorans]
MTYIYFALLVFIWSYSWVVAKVALEFTNPIAFSLLRTIIGTLAIFLFIVLVKKIHKPKEPFLVALLGLTQTTLFFIFANLSLVSGGAGKVSLLIYTMPFWSIIFANIILKETVSRAQKFAIIGSFLGLVFIIEPWRLYSNFLSDFFALLSAISWAISITIAKIILNKQKMSILSLNFYQMLFGLIGILICYLFIPQQKETIFSPYLIFAVLYTGIIATALGWFLWLYVLEKMKVNIASLSSLAVPILTILESWFQLGEKPDTFETCGIVLIALSLLLIYLDATFKVKKVATKK